VYQGVATRNGVTTREILRYKILRHSIGA
jgi:hypothetical protein